MLSNALGVCAGFVGDHVGAVHGPGFLDWFQDAPGFEDFFAGGEKGLVGLYGIQEDLFVGFVRVVELFVEVQLERMVFYAPFVVRHLGPKA